MSDEVALALMLKKRQSPEANARASDERLAPPPTRRDERANPLRYLSAKQVMRRYADISQMTLWRWLRDGILPPPDLVRNRLRFWREDRLDAHDAEKMRNRSAA